jgi:hypothetical protein
MTEASHLCVFLYPIHNRIYIALNDDDNPNFVPVGFDSNELNSIHTVPLKSSIDAFGDIHDSNGDVSICHFASLSDIYRFNDMATKLAENTGLKLLFNISREVQWQTRISFLLGCHMIMFYGLGFEETYLSFKPLHAIFEKYESSHGLSVSKSLRAVCCAKCLNWIDFRLPDLQVKTNGSSIIQLDKFVHDERCAELPKPRNRLPVLLTISKNWHGDDDAPRSSAHHARVQHDSPQRQLVKQSACFVKRSHPGIPLQPPSLPHNVIQAESG